MRSARLLGVAVDHCCPLCKVAATDDRLLYDDNPLDASGTEAVTRSTAYGIWNSWL